MIERTSYLAKLHTALRRSPATALLGPRQCGKTTLAKALSGAYGGSYFDLESPRDQLRLQNPELALARHTGLVILDEVQREPGLFPVLRVLMDRPDNPARFLLLGSASPTLIRSAGESLAGRVEFVDLHGFDIEEASALGVDVCWSRGGFPRSALAPSDADSLAWREAFLRTFLQQDLPQFGIQVPEPTMRRFWTMLAHAHGHVLNASGLARSMGMSDKTIRAYVDHLEQTYMVRVLPPWFENLKKRQVKAPKVYVRDSGLLHALLSIPDLNGLLGHPVAGFSWEGFAMEQVLRIHGFEQAYFWTAHSGPELDLFVLHAGRRIGFEFKYAESPHVSRSMRVAQKDLALDTLYLVYPGRDRIELADGMEAIGLIRVAELRL